MAPAQLGHRGALTPRRRAPVFQFRRRSSSLRIEVRSLFGMKARVLSGVQPSGQLHIGNYLGALKNWAEIQSLYESIFCIVDLHAITIYQKPDELKAKIREIAGIFFGGGDRPEAFADHGAI